MHYLKRNTRFSIFAFLIIVLSITISISTLAKTEVQFSLYDNPQKFGIININSVPIEKLASIIQISNPLTQKDNYFKRRIKRIQRPASPYPTTRNKYSLMGGMERRGDSNYY